MFKIKQYLPVLLFCILLIFSRFYNLQRTARFIWDESSDLVRMHQIYSEKNLTLIGPISEDGNKVFSSLTYYLLLPFTIIAEFHPIGPIYATAFYGSLTVILLILLTRKLNKDKVIFYLSALLFIVWYPLVETSRWAWNPNLIPLWSVLSILMFVKNKKWSLLLAGTFLGLTVHQHYVGFFALCAFWLVIFLRYGKRAQFPKIFILSVGILFALSPFIIFDMTHPPGLFLSRILYFNYLGSSEGGIYNLIPKFIAAFNGTFKYLIPVPFLMYLSFLPLTLLIFKDIKQRSDALIYIFIFIVQLAGSSLIENFYPHYIIPGIIFFLVYLIYPRQKNVLIYQKIVLLILIIASLTTIKSQLTKVSWENDIRSISAITDIIAEEIVQDDLKNNNIAVVAGPDPNTYGRRYRDLLGLRGISFKTRDEYNITDHLFVVSTAQESVIRNDRAYEMSYFNKGELFKKWEIDDSQWIIYLFKRS